MELELSVCEPLRVKYLARGPFDLGILVDAGLDGELSLSCKLEKAAQEAAEASVTDIFF